MKSFRLFTAFHANLDFSALPENDRPTVLARCYWPLLSLPERLGIRMGFELSARTLEILLAEDPEWVKRFIGLVENGLVEPIGSGRAQIVAPLAPTEINRLNLKLGAERYAELLGRTPSTWLVNEQTWSDGLAPIYQEAGAERIVMEWNNPAARRPELRPLRCRPARLRVGNGPGPMVLWNDSIVFQKVQRVAHGQIPESDLLDYVEALSEREGAQALCAYGGDVEIFDYRPSRKVPDGAPGAEMDRLLGIFERLAGDDRFEFVLPSEVEPPRTEKEPVWLASPEDPLPCKKQPRYNPTRWAVSGRDGLAMNTRCEALLRTERGVRRLAPDRRGGIDGRALVDLWRSDFRTRATEEKIQSFEAGMGLAQAESDGRLAELAPPLSEGEDVVLTHPGSRSWDAMPVEIPLRFAPGRHRDLEVVVREGRALGEADYQIDVHGRYRDGSIREAVLVLTPTLVPGEELSLAFVSGEGRSVEDETDHVVHEIGTESVQARFLNHRGGALEGLAFPILGSTPVLGTIPHGHFDSIGYTPDFYSGHVVALTEHAEKRTDLTNTGLVLRKAWSGPVRVALEGTFESAFGPWRKRFFVYRTSPRLDVVHDLSFHDARLASLRLGTVTLRPDAWDRGSLRYGTVNGGAGVEWRGLPEGARIRQSDAVSSSVTATSCLGATEGWVALADRERGVLVSTNRASAAVVPMLDFEDVDEGFFLRLGHTAAESDETRASFLRGRLAFRFAIEGFDPVDGATIDRARVRQQGLIYRTENGVGITSGL